MQKILIIGAGVEQIGAIKTAKEMGHTVIVTDMNPNAPGIKYADNFYEVSTTDAKENIKIGKKENINGVMTVCSETAVPTVAKVAQELKLPGFSEETAKMATNKAKMREALSIRNINVSPFIIAKTMEDVNDFVSKNKGAWVFKPVDSSGQRGTSIIENISEVENAFLFAKENSPTKEVLLDKFIKGREVHVTMQIINKKAHFLAISDRITLDKNNFGIAVRHIGPSELNEDLLNKIKDISQNSINAIGLENGVATCEIIIQENIPYLMEVAIRVPGGYLREVAMYLSGVDIYKTTIWNCLGINKEYSEIVSIKKNNAVSVKFISALNLVENLNVIKKINKEIIKNSNIRAINFHFEPEFIVPKLKSSVGRFAVIITTGTNRKEAVKLSEQVFNALKFNNTKLIEYNNYNKYNVKFNHYLINKNV